MEPDRKLLPYYGIAHFSRYIHPGGVRIGFPGFSDLLEADSLKKTHGERVLVVMNKSGKEIKMPPESTASIC